MAANTDVLTHVVIPDIKKSSSTRGLNEKFLDFFWKLAEPEPNVRLEASLEIVKSINATESTESQLKYTVGRLVQGLASTRQCARHGYFIALVGILGSSSASKLPNQVFYDAVQNRLKPQGSKGEKTDLLIGQLLAYGALFKSGRSLSDEELLILANHFISGSKIKSYVQPIAFPFLTEMLLTAEKTFFKTNLWPVMKAELALSWEQHSFDTLNLLLVAQEKFPKIVKQAFFQKNLGCEKISDPECFAAMCQYILRNSSHIEHQIFAKISTCLLKSGGLTKFWTEHFDLAVAPESRPSKTKTSTALNLLNSLITVVDKETVVMLLTKNVVQLLMTNLAAKDDSSFPIAERVMNSIKAILESDDTTPATQSSIMEKLLQLMGQTDSDQISETRLVADVSSSLKKESVEHVAVIYRKFIEENSKTQERIFAMQQLARLVSHTTVQREVSWKASQIVFFARWAYFTPSASKSLASAAKDTLFKVLDSPCKKLEDLSNLLSLVVNQLSELIPTGDFTDEVKSTWQNLLEIVKKIGKKEKSIKKEDAWTTQVFLVLFLNMAMELLREPVLAAEVIGELDACYTKATEKKKKKNAKGPAEEEPNWLEVVTDILLSLLSQDQHLLRSLVLSVWSLLANHITVAALQQVLDVIDPSKSETPLVDAEAESSDEDDEEDGEEDDAKEEDAKDDGKGEADEELEDSDDEDGEDDDDVMDEEESGIDKLRMQLHEVLKENGGDNAGTDTESVNMDDLSDGEMKSLDQALSSAFQGFRKNRPARKNDKKLPKEKTALMHFRLRCLDLVEALAAKEIGIDLASACLLPLLALLEATVKEPLQKPLMNRARTALRKMTNIRRFAESSNGNLDELVKLLQSLFLKPYTKKTLMPYIGEDLVQCSSFVLRCALHISRETPESNGEAPHFEMEELFKPYHSNLSKYFLKRDSSFPFGIYVRALQYPWPDAGFLMEPLIEYAFGANMLKNRKLQALQLLTALFRNTTALTALGPQLNKQLQSLLQHTHKVLEEADKDAKPKYLTELFILLRVMYQCPIIVKLDDFKQLWEPVKTALPSLLSKGAVKAKELKKSFTTLARVMEVSLDIPASEAVVTTTTAATVEVASTADVDVKEKPAKKKQRKSLEKNKERTEAKKRRIAAAAEGVGDMTFAVAGFAEEVTAEEESVQEPKKKKKKKEKPAKEAVTNGIEEEAVAETVTEDVQMEVAQSEVVEEKKSKKKKKKVVVEEASQSVEMEVAPVTTEKKVTRKKKEKN